MMVFQMFQPELLLVPFTGLQALRERPFPSLLFEHHVLSAFFFPWR